MAFHDVQFPTNIGYGSSGGPSFKTEVIELDSGQERRVSRWSQPRHQFSVAYGVRDYSDLAALKRFYIAREGAAHSFRFKDFLDFTTAEVGTPASMGGGTPNFNDQLVAIGDGATKEFQLVKRYESGGVVRVRSITKPVVSTVTIAVAGVQASPSTFTVDGATGKVLFNTAPPNAHAITWGGEFDVHARFAEETDDLLSITHEDFGSGGAPSVRIQEVLDPSEQPDEFYYGGATYVDDANVVLSPSTARVYVLAPTSADREARLPEIDADTPPGGPYFYVRNEIGSGNDVLVKDWDGSTTLATLSPGDTATVLLAVDSSGDPQWLVF